MENTLTFSNSELLKTQMPALTGDSVARKRIEIREYFHKTFTLDEQLFECLKDDDSFFIKANPLRHPLIFYYGHTAVFYVNKLFVANLIPSRIDPKLESILAVGVDEMSWDDLNVKNNPWPTVSEVKSYRNKVRQLVDEFIMTAPLELPITWEDPFWIINMGIEHERIHIETSSVLIRELPIERVQTHPLFQDCPISHAAPNNELLPVTGATIKLGKDLSDPYYGWDNEYGEQSVKVPDFKASKYLVSNEEFFQFMLDDGYQNDKFWTEEGHQWKSFSKVTHPRFWVPHNETYKYRTLTSEISMPWSWPVDINYHEAKAFCNWKSEKENKIIRMPTEPEWMVLRNKVDTDQPRWDRAPGNINLEHWASSCPVDYFKFGKDFYDIIGNIWQWTETPISPLNGFQVHPAYDDFSVPTFDQNHNLIKGGCFFSTGNYALKDSRYAFRKHFYQHAGLRYIQAESETLTEDLPMNPYETDGLINQYMEFHFGSEYFSIPNFAKQCAKLCIKYMEQKKTRKALDLGCAVGRSSFELAKTFEHVDGIDFSARFIQQATTLQQEKTIHFSVPTEGDLKEYKHISLEEIGLSEIQHKCRFMQGDACNLPDKFTGYDLVFAGNLIDRLYFPDKFLKSIHSRMNPGSLLILTSPYTWLEEYTPKEQWVGGFKQNGENLTTLEGLKKSLQENFNFLTARDVPFVIRETARKFQHTLAQMTVWELK